MRNLIYLTVFQYLLLSTQVVPTHGIRGDIYCQVFPLLCPNRYNCALECEEGHEAHWGYYEEDGPECWNSCYTTCESGREQSPINMVESSMESVDYSPIQFDGYHLTRSMTLSNNGHSATVKLEADTYYIFELGLDDPYVADSFHFHWGDSDSEGSEHQMGGVSAPLEMHIVHYSTDYSSLGEALGNEGGVAVLGFEFHVGLSDNDHFADIVNSLPEICYKGSEKVLNNQKLSDYLPAWYSGRYYRYMGSLTTPGCTEGVIWTLFDDTIPISSAQLRAFRSTLYSDTEQSAHAHIVHHNYRPTQPLNGRKVYRGSF